MPEIHVPFAHGVQEGIDPKLLPDGWLSRAENVRFRKDGRLGTRFGYDFLSNTPSPAVASGPFAPKHTVYIRQRQTAGLRAEWLDRRADGNFTIVGQTSSVTDLGVPRRVQAVRNIVYSVASCDCVTADAYVYCVFADYDPVTATSNNGAMVVLEQTSGRLVTTLALPFPAVGTARNIKILTIGTTVMVFWANASDEIKVQRFTASDPYTPLGAATVATAASGRGFAYDVAPLDGSTCLLVYESTATNLKWGTVTSAGTFTSKADQVTANPSRPSITLGGSGNVAVVWAEGASFQVGNVHYKVDTTAGAAVTAKTTLDSSGLATGFPVAGNAGATDNIAFAWNRSDNKCSTSYAGGNIKSYGFLAVVSKPYVGPNSGLFVWTANYSHSSLTAGLATYKLIDAHTTTDGAGMDAICCQHAALPGAYMVGSDTNFDPRRFSVSATAVVSAPSTTATVILLPVVSPKGYAADIVRIDSGTYVDRLLTAKINGTLFFSGARMCEFDGSSFYESGLADGTEYLTVTNAGAGSIAAGTRQYVIVDEWADAYGRRHRSPPSLPVTIETASASDHLVTYSIPASSDRRNICKNIYRTTDGGTIFYLVNSTKNLPVGDLNGATQSYTDSATDAAISVNEVLYTQGARGGLSGLLPNDEPPPCRFIWAGNNRLIMGGLEDPSAVQWSKLVFPNEPVQFSIDDAFRAKVDGEVTAVASLDGVWYVFTAGAIWAITGDGPDDTGGGGSFSDPQKLPSEVGCISQRSIVEVPNGLLFQGLSDRLYLLPRGGGAPQWVGQNVRDTLTTYPFISSATLVPAENVVVFTCLASDGSDGRFIVYDTRIGEWTVDIPYASATSAFRRVISAHVYNGKFHYSVGTIIAQTSAYADDESGSQSRVIPMTLVTGDMRPFGVLGHGRFRRFVALSEYRSATTFTIEESLDGGVTYQTAASYTPSGSAGATVKTMYDLPLVRGESYRFRIISTPTSVGEGFVFNSITGEVYPDKGTPRLADAVRQ